MKSFALLTLLLLPSIAHAQAGPDDCLKESENGRVSGRVEFVSWEHPFHKTIITGYKLILLQPKCFDFFSAAKWQDDRIDIGEIEIDTGHEPFFESNVGRLVTVTGSVSAWNPYAIAWPQITDDSHAVCEIAPNSKGVEKC